MPTVQCNGTLWVDDLFYKPNNMEVTGFSTWHHIYLI